MVRARLVILKQGLEVESDIFECPLLLCLCCFFLDLFVLLLVIVVVLVVLVVAIFVCITATCINLDSAVTSTAAITDLSRSDSVCCGRTSSHRP